MTLVAFLIIFYYSIIQYFIFSIFSKKLSESVKHGKQRNQVRLQYNPRPNIQFIRNIHLLTIFRTNWTTFLDAPKKKFSNIDFGSEENSDISPPFLRTIEIVQGCRLPWNVMSKGFRKWASVQWHIFIYLYTSLKMLAHVNKS